MHKSTVAASFMKSMAGLTATLRRTNCSFVRCVKPNQFLTPASADLDLGMVPQTSNHDPKFHDVFTNVRWLLPKKACFVRMSTNATGAHVHTTHARARLHSHQPTYAHVRLFVHSGRRSVEVPRHSSGTTTRLLGNLFAPAPESLTQSKENRKPPLLSHELTTTARS